MRGRSDSFDDTETGLDGKSQMNSLVDAESYQARHLICSSANMNKAIPTVQQYGSKAQATNI